jgi:hypothetical protein
MFPFCIQACEARTSRESDGEDDCACDAGRIIFEELLRVVDAKRADFACSADPCGEFDFDELRIENEFWLCAQGSLLLLESDLCAVRKNCFIAVC